MEFEFTDRYKALGIPYPNKETMCDGECEGIGFYPIYMPDSLKNNPNILCLSKADEYTIDEIRLWHKAHKRCGFFGRIKTLFSPYWKQTFKKCDGWHFIKCSACNGSGKKGKNG